MIARHPWSWLPEDRLVAVFSWSLALTLVLIVALQWSGSSLRTEPAPAGILSFELAGTLTASNAILESWGPERKAAAGFNLGIDYLFLFAYATSIGLACALLARRFPDHSFARSLGMLLSWGTLVAAGLDAIENYALTRLLRGSQNPGLPARARWTATIKFVLVAGGLAYMVIAALSHARRQ